MLKKIILILLSPVLLFGEVSLDSQKHGDIVVNNRILLKINGEAISVVDVVKKMDLIFYRQYPQLINNPMARYEFYMTNFQGLFFALVNDYMVLADSEDKEIEVTDGDIREELESLFGPDVVANIDKIGLTFDEAWELLKREITVRRMNMMMVRSKAMSEVHPKELKVLYDEYVKQNPAQNVWHYHILTFKGNEKEKVQNVADKAFLQMTEKNITPFDVSLIFKESDTEFSLSDEFVRSEKEISSSHKAVLEKLNEKGVSHPSLQANLKEPYFVAKIFYLKEQKRNVPITFAEIQDKLEHELLQKAVMRYSEQYSEKLRERYGITNEYISQMIPQNFQPFALR